MRAKFNAGLICHQPCFSLKLKNVPPAGILSILKTVRKNTAMRILVVEDEPRLQRNLAKALREEGYAVDAAGDGDDGFFKAETYNYDAIVLDVMLPGLDGWEMLKRLRKMKKTPVLMLTARHDDESKVAAAGLYCEGYFAKPVKIDALLAALNRCCEQGCRRT